MVCVDDVQENDLGLPSRYLERSSLLQGILTGTIFNEK